MLRLVSAILSAFETQDEIRNLLTDTQTPALQTYTLMQTGTHKANVKAFYDSISEIPLWEVKYNVK